MTQDPNFAGKTIALDFDGVLHSYTSGWTGHVPIDPPVEGALEAVRRLLDAGAELIVYTTRAETPEGAMATVAWLQQHGFPPLAVTAGKPKAVAYIDDRAVPFAGDWDDAIERSAALIDLHPRPWRPKLTDEPGKVTKLTGRNSIHSPGGGRREDVAAALRQRWTEDHGHKTQPFDEDLEHAFWLGMADTAMRAGGG